MMSLEALFNAGARLCGGVLVALCQRQDAVAAGAGNADHGPDGAERAPMARLMLVYAVGIGIGYGLTFFASTILLLDYFGRGPNLELFATVNLISTIGSAGPAFAGFVADHTGSFVPAFVMLAALVLHRADWRCCPCSRRTEPAWPRSVFSCRWRREARASAFANKKRSPHDRPKEFGVFLPVANGGWIVSRNTPAAGWRLAAKSRRRARSPKKKAWIS